ncbi:hypothetical protein ERJ75_001756000 [Trypanosoma vivax]|nr:hypothetical protein ERJ75_001756000 [Trypanosoma vivax]
MLRSLRFGNAHARERESAVARTELAGTSPTPTRLVRPHGWRLRYVLPALGVVTCRRAQPLTSPHSTSRVAQGGLTDTRVPCPRTAPPAPARSGHAYSVARVRVVDTGAPARVDTTLPFPERSHRGRATHGRRAKGGVIARHALGWRRVTSTHVRDTRAQVRHNVSDLPARVSRCALTRPCSCVRPRAVATVSRTETDSECRGRSGRPPLARQVAWLGTSVLFGNRPYWEKGFAPALVHACVGPALCLLSLSDSLGKRPPRRTGYETEREFARGDCMAIQSVRWVVTVAPQASWRSPDGTPVQKWPGLGTSQNGSSGAEVRTRAALTTSLAALDAERDRPSARALHARCVDMRQRAAGRAYWRGPTERSGKHRVCHDAGCRVVTSSARGEWQRHKPCASGMRAKRQPKLRRRDARTTALAATGPLQPHRTRPSNGGAWICGETREALAGRQHWQPRGFLSYQPHPVVR